MATTEQLIADYLARGGKINHLPEKRVVRATLIPEAVKKRNILADLRDRARGGS